MSGRGVPLRGALPDHDVTKHIVDWLTADFLGSAAWLNHVDDQGRPRKLMKCGSIAQLSHEADKAMRMRLQGKSFMVDAGDEITLASLTEGFVVMRLLSSRALDLESQRMQHCIGHGAYDEALSNGTTEIYSLRDKTGRPHVTIEVDVHPDEAFPPGGPLSRASGPVRRTLWQLQGRCNKRPPPIHMRVLRPFLEHFEDWKRLYPIVTDVHGTEHEADNIPKGAVFSRLTFTVIANLSDREITLPEDLTILGDLDLRGACLTSLPEGLQVDGNLHIGDSVITQWPAEIGIGGCILGGESCPTERIPEHVTAKMEEGRAWKHQEDKQWEASLQRWLETDVSQPPPEPVNAPMQCG
ncbi:hypothetical protein GCM10010837_42910 [Aminobacter niigataensis]